MATTASGISYPTLADPPNVPGYMQAQAESLETLIAFPLCKLILASNFSVANSSNAISVPFGAGSEARKTHASMHSTTVNTTRVIPPIPGDYKITINTVYAPNTSGFRTHTVGLNGVRQAPEGGIYTASGLPAGANAPLPQIAVQLRANGTTDYFELFTFQNSGGALNIVGDGTTTNTANTMMTVEYLRP